MKKRSAPPPRGGTPETKAESKVITFPARHQSAPKMSLEWWDPWHFIGWATRRGGHGGYDGPDGPFPGDPAGAFDDLGRKMAAGTIAVRGWPCVFDAGEIAIILRTKGVLVPPDWIRTAELIERGGRWFLAPWGSEPFALPPGEIRGAASIGFGGSVEIRGVPVSHDHVNGYLNIEFRRMDVIALYAAQETAGDEKAPSPAMVQSDPAAGEAKEPPKALVVDPDYEVPREHETILQRNNRFYRNAAKGIRKAAEGTETEAELSKLSELKRGMLAQGTAYIVRNEIDVKTGEPINEATVHKVLRDKKDRIQALVRKAEPVRP